jgi:general stress protein YciG
MTEGPKNAKRPRDVVGNAVRVMEIATGQREEEAKPEKPKNEAAAELGRKGGKARAKALTPEQRREIAKKAARSRWPTAPAPSEEE